MATIKRRFVFSTSILSGIATLFIIISLSTEQWIVCNKAEYIDLFVGDFASIQYGLFQGTINKKSPSPRTLVLSMTCTAKEGICAMLCASDADSRQDLLKSIYNNEPVSQNDEQCPSVKLANVLYHNLEVQNNPGTNPNRKFINYGIWVCTITFLVLALVFGAVSSGLAIYNTVSNPIEVYLSIYGLYIYNTVAMCSCVMALTLWGVAHLFTTYHDVAVFYTLVGYMKSDGKSNLGYSFWLLLIPVFLYFGSVCVLYVRHYQISKEPGKKVIQREESADPVIYLF